MPLADVATLKAWARDKLGNADDLLLERLLSAASVEFGGLCNRIFEAASQTRYFDGSAALGRNNEILVFDTNCYPVYHAVAPGLLTVVENGIALSVGVGYQTSVDVILDGVGLERPLRLRRRPTGISLAVQQTLIGYDSSPWAPGTQNVVVSGWAGYGAASGLRPVPDPIQHVCCEIAYLLYVKPAMIGVASRTKAGGSATFQEELSPFAKAVINDYTMR